jgi:uncharacterized membrane protein YkoI
VQTSPPWLRSGGFNIHSLKVLSVDNDGFANERDAGGHSSASERTIRGYIEAAGRCRECAAVRWEEIVKFRYLTGLVAILVASNAFAFAGAKYLSQAAVPPAHARKLALKAYPGKIVSEELEKESGGSGLRYSFVILHDREKHEVGVDAKTGKVLENSMEGERPD